MDKSGFVPSHMLLLTNGTVMVQDIGSAYQGTGNWYGLVPDSHGCYSDGRWIKLGSMPSGYGPHFDASQVLDNGDAIVEGGESNVGGGTFSTQGAVYNPVTNEWSSISRPSTAWNGGDVASVVLPDGNFMMSNTVAGDAYVLNTSTLKWNPTPVPGNVGDMDEEGWSLLHNGDVFTVETTAANSGSFNDSDHSRGQVYDPSSNTWRSVGYSPAILGSGCSIPPALTGTGSGTGHSLAIAECPQNYWLQGGYTKAGQAITYLYAVANYGAHSISGISITSDRTKPSCPKTTLTPGQSMTCTGSYTTKSSDLTNNACSPNGSCVIDTSSAHGLLVGSKIKSNTASYKVYDSSCNACQNGEMGPQPVLPDGDVFTVGASGYNALYDPATGHWTTSRAMDFPEIRASKPASCGDTSQYTWQQAQSIDDTAAVLPDGNVVVPGGAGVHCPLVYYEFNGTTLHALSSQPAIGASQNNDNASPFPLDLPTGQVLWNGGSEGDFLDLYTETGAPKSNWRPVVSKVVASLDSLSPGATAEVVGTQLNGLTEGTSEGDDEQDATDYPIVKITNDASGLVTYARTFGLSTRSIAPGQSSSAQFTFPDNTPVGPSKLQVIANGIASAPVATNVYGQQKVPKADTDAAPAVALVGSSSNAPCGASRCYVLAWEGASGTGLWWDTAPAGGSPDTFSWSGEKEIPNFNSSAGPALGVLGGNVGDPLYMAWKDSSDSGMSYSSLNGSTWSGKHSVPNAGTSTTPALAGTTLNCGSGGPSGRILFLAWKGQGSDTRLFYGYTKNGSSWTIVGQVPDAASDSAPSLTILDSADVYLTWKVAGATTIDQSSLDFCKSGATWTTPAALEGAGGTGTGPATAAEQGVEGFAAWKGESDTDTRIFTNYFSGSSASNQQQVLNVATSASPALANVPSNASLDVLMAWKGASDNQIWVGPLAHMAKSG